MDWLASIAGSASGGPLGLLFGVVGGGIKNWLDYKKVKTQAEADAAKRKDDYAHELAVMGKEGDIAKDLAGIKADEVIESTRMTAIAEVQKYDKATYSNGLIAKLGDKWFHRLIKALLVAMMVSVDFMRGAIRPGTTMYYQFMVAALGIWSGLVINEAVSQAAVDFDINGFALGVMLRIVDAVITGASATLSYYFMTRPNRTT